MHIWKELKVYIFAFNLFTIADQLLPHNARYSIIVYVNNREKEITHHKLWIRRKSLMLLFVCDHSIELRFDCLKLMSLDPMIYTNQINHINNCFKQCRSTACYCMNHLSLIVFQVCLSNMLWYRIENYAFEIVKKRMFPNLYTMIYIFCMLIFFDQFLFENQFFSLKIFFWKI